MKLINNGGYTTINGVDYIVARVYSNTWNLINLYTGQSLIYNGEALDFNRSLDKRYISMLNDIPDYCNIGQMIFTTDKYQGWLIANTTVGVKLIGLEDCNRWSDSKPIGFEQWEIEEHLGAKITHVGNYSKFIIPKELFEL